MSEELKAIFDNVDENGNIRLIMKVEEAAALLDVLQFTKNMTENLSTAELIKGDIKNATKLTELSKCAALLFNLAVENMGAEVPDNETIH